MPMKLNEVKLKVRAECLVQNWHVINVLSFFFHPLTFWTCIKKKEGFSVPTNHLWISPQYSFNLPTTWFSPFTSLFLFFLLCVSQTEEASQSHEVPWMMGSLRWLLSVPTRPYSLLIPSLSFHTHTGWLVHDPPSSSVTFFLRSLAPGRNTGAEVGRKRLCLHLRSVSLAWAPGGSTCSREGSLWQQASFQLDSISWVDIWRLLLSPG